MCNFLHKWLQSYLRNVVNVLHEKGGMKIFGAMSLIIVFISGLTPQLGQKNYQYHCAGVEIDNLSWKKQRAEWLRLPDEKLYGWREKHIYWWGMEGGNPQGPGYVVYLCYTDDPSGFGYYRARLRYKSMPLKLPEEIADSLIEAAKSHLVSSTRDGIGAKRYPELEVLFAKLVNETYIALRLTPPPTIIPIRTPTPTRTITSSPTYTEAATQTPLPTLTLTPTSTLTTTPRPTNTPVLSSTPEILSVQTSDRFSRNIEWYVGGIGIITIIMIIIVTFRKYQGK